MELRLGQRVFAVLTLAGLLVAAAGVGGFLLARKQAGDHARQAFYRVLTPAELEFAGAIDASVEGLTEFGIPGSASPAESSGGRAGLDAITRVDAAGPATARNLLAALAQRGVTLRPRDGLAAIDRALDAALDAGAVRASAPIVSSGSASPRTLFVLPVFRAGAPVDTTAGRRAGLSGFVVGVMRPHGPAAQLLGPAAAAGGSVQLNDGDTVLFRAGPAPGASDATLVTRVAVAGRSWAIAGRPDTGSTSTTPTLLLAASLLIGASLLAAGRYLDEAEKRVAARAREREDDLLTVADIGPLLQESLDLAEVLPGATAFLAARFGLDGVSVSYLNDAGQLVEAFTVGRRLAGIPRWPGELRGTPSEIPPGEVATVPLLRAGRVIGAIHVLAGHPLSSDRTRTLVAVAEMIGTAVANARQFEREQETVRRLQELDRLKTEFLGTVSHELRTPITAILGFSSLLHEEFETIPAEQRRDFVGRVARNAASLNTLVQELLDFSRVGRPSFELHIQEIDLTEVTARVLEQFATLLQHHRVLVEAPGAVWAFADPEGVERVISNLLSNAAKFSPPDTVITVTLGPHLEGVTLMVDDAGPGVAPDDRPLIFQRFFRGDSSAAMATRGAGIGLAIVKDLVERMQGTVEVIGAPGGGARFVVVLPARPGSPTAPPSESAQGRTS